jgi:phosphatidylglycerophosphate synthase
MSHDTWIHRAARVVARPLVRTPVTPNQVTTLRLAAGMAAAAALAQGEADWRHWGAGIFVLSMFLDRLDGEVARLGGKTSPWGHRYDLVSDTLCNAFAFLGLGVGLRGGEFGAWAPVMGLVAGLAIATILWLVVRMELRHGVHAGELGTTAGFDPDDGMMAVPVLVWFGMSNWLLAAACVGAPAFAIYLAIKFRKDS